MSARKDERQTEISIDPIYIRGYTTGSDIIRWIIDNNLENRIVYGTDNLITFELESYEDAGVNITIYGGLDLNTGLFTRYSA